MIADTLDLDRYPIADLDTPAGQALLARSREALARENLLLLPGFIRPAATARLAGELLQALPSAYRRDRTIEGIGTYRDHPASANGRRIEIANRSRQAILAGDQIPQEGGLWTLFRWQPLTDFIAAVVGVERLYRSADPLAALSATALGDGDTHGWHFDENDFVVSLLLQEPEAGGQFEVLPDARVDAGIDYERCAAALAGTAADLRRPRLEAGTLSLFRGQRALHRVSPVVGNRQRLIALFSYDRRPGMMFSSAVHLAAFGRRLEQAPNTQM